MSVISTFLGFCCLHTLLTSNCLPALLSHNGQIAAHFASAMLINNLMSMLCVSDIRSCNCRYNNYRSRSAHSYNTFSHNATGTHHAVSYSLVCNFCFCAGASMLTTRILPLKLTLTLTLTLTPNVMRHGLWVMRHA